LRIDVHNHGVPEAVVELLTSDSAYGVEVTRGLWSGGQHPVAFEFGPTYYDPDAKLRSLDAIGIEAAVVSAMPPILFTDLDEDRATELARAVNGGLAEWQAAHPDRIRWMAQVPMQAPAAAVAVLEEAAARGAVGVQVGTSIEGARLDEPRFEPFWEAAGRLGLPVLPHPFGNEPHRGLAPYYLQNVIGNQLETTLTVERLIASGTLDRHPGAQVLAVHAGGYFPWQAGRYAHARTVRPELTDAPEDPWAYVGRIVVDTITHDVEALRYLISRLHADNVLLGTDLPFDMATGDPIAQLEAAADAATVKQIAEDNPARLFGFAD
jgi:aminocarboxymuconate-semialdehyde decarboxylase